MILLLMTSLLYAQDNDRNIVYKKKTEIDFEGVDIEGQLVKPQGALLLDRKRASFNPLIKLRTDFNPEMSLSVHEVK
jgi:RNase P/RNase MRP subunit p29